MEISTNRNMSVSGVPSGTVTFLFTDIEGSTKLLEQLRVQYALLLDDQRQILRAAFARWNGSEIDTQGDSVFAVFPRAIDAICCMMEAQRELAKHTWPKNVKLGVRMGLHTGEPIQVRDGFIGMDVHRAARIAAAGHGGQVLVSQTTRELVFQDLPKGISLRDLGQYKLKDIRFPQQIYQLDIEGLPQDFPPLKTLSLEEEPPTPGNAPYKGLQYFDETDAEWFFGRERDVELLVQAVMEQRFLAVIGASGSGKSSTIRAGLVPTLKRKYPGKITAHILTPTSHPLESLAISLTRQEQSVTTAATLIDDFERDTRSLYLHIKRSIPKSPDDEILLVIDQFEELFTQCRNELERKAFVENLLYAAGAQESSVRVVMALRADFYQHLAQFSGLRTEVAKHQEYLGAMEAEELRKAIEEPAHQGGWEFSPGLVELILHDIGAAKGHQPEPGALPLLSHALLETWKRRRANVMNLRSYSEAGGVRRAIARTAESVYYGDLTSKEQEIARNIFLRLTELGEGTQDTRRCISIDELIPPTQENEIEPIRNVLVKLADARLITTSENTVEVAHEALIREWPLLREWLTQDREGLRLHRHMTESAQEWERLNRDSGALYRGARLLQALEWTQANPNQLNSQEQAFLQASQEFAQREQAEREAQHQRELEAAQKLAEAEKMRAQEQERSASRLRQRAMYLTVVVIIAALMAVAAVVLASFARNSSQIAHTNAQSAQAAEARAEYRSTQAINMQNTAQAESIVRATAEANAIEQRKTAQEQANLASSRELAAAAITNLEIDPERSILLAIEALRKAHTLEAENALHQALLASRLVASIPADTQSVFGITVSPDGSKFATAGLDGVVKLWSLNDLSTLSEESPIQILENPIDFNVSYETGGYTLAFNPDGNLLAVIGDKQSARIWDLDSDQLLHTLSHQGGNIYSITFDSDGKKLVTTNANGTAKVWDALTGHELLTITVPESAMYGAIFSPNGRWLITGSDDGIARFWDLKASPVMEQISLSFDLSTEGLPGAFAFSPDAKYLAIGAGVIAKVWDFEELLVNPLAKPLFTLFGHHNYINRILYTSDGSRLLTGNADGTARVWDADTGQELLILAGGSGNINSLSIAPDGRYPLTAHSDGHVRVWDISHTAGHEWWTIYPVYRGQFASDGRHLATASFPSELTGETMFQLWRLSPSGAEKEYGITVRPGAIVSAIGFNSELSRYATIDLDMNFKMWEPTNGQLLQSFSISGTESSIGHHNIVSGLDFSPDGTRVATSDDDGLTIIWDLTSGKPLLPLSSHEAPVFSIAFNPNGTQLATAGFDGTARIWNATTGQLLQTLSGHSAVLSNVKFNSDGKHLLTSSSDTNVIMWDVQTGEELLTLAGHASTVFGLDFSPDDSLIATGSTDGSAKVWDASTGQALLTFPGLWVEFTPDGKGLMTISVSDLVARGFYLDLDELIAFAHSQVTRSLTPGECQIYLHMAHCPSP